MMTFTANNNGRIRFTLGRTNGFVAVRKIKYRWGFSQGTAFTQVHLGKFSVALERKATHKKLWNWTNKEVA